MACPMVVVQNMSYAPIDLMESFHLAPPGQYSYKIHLPPFQKREFPADKFYDRNLSSGRSSVIVPHVSGVETSPLLTPQVFQRYVKILLYLDEHGELIIKGIKPKFTDFGRLWGFGVIFGRNYDGRPEEMIR